jgi:hypothetical protein
MNQEIFCHRNDMYNKELITRWVMVCPKDDKWSHKSLYDVMMACEDVQCLKGVYLHPYGLAWKPTDRSRKQQEKSLRKMLKGRYERSIRQFVCYQQMLETSPVISIPSYIHGFPTYTKCFQDWKTQMPCLTDFKETKDMDELEFMLGHKVMRDYVRCMVFKADAYLPLETLAQFVKVLASLGHRIISTAGFHMDLGTDSVTAQRQKQCHYITCAEAGEIERRDEERREERRKLPEKKNDAARKIQRAFQESIANPAYKMCRDRLMREFADLGS